MASYILPCACLVLLAAISATDAVSCFSCNYAEGTYTGTNAVLKSFLSSMTSGSSTSCKDGTNTAKATCSTPCSKGSGTLKFTIGSESMTIKSVRRGCQSQMTGSAYTEYNKAGCHSYDDKNPYAKDMKNSYTSGTSGLTLELDGEECLCTTTDCNSAAMLGVSVICMLFLAALAHLVSF